LWIVSGTEASKLAIVIDDFGYRPVNENKILQLPLPISIAILPHAPYARSMAIKAHNQGREILIHLPMAPLSKQPLERDTLHPQMSIEEIQRIIRQAIINVPYAVEMNNHMGSAMTSNLPAMKKVMQVLDQYQLYFLDSLTINNSQVSRAAQGTGIKVIKRQIFLDQSLTETAIRQQFNQAVALARRHGAVIAIGHPHPATILVLQKMLPELPADVTLVPPSALLNKNLITSPSKTKMAVQTQNKVKSLDQDKIQHQRSEKIDKDYLLIALVTELMQPPMVKVLIPYSIIANFSTFTSAIDFFTKKRLI